MAVQRLCTFCQGITLQSLESRTTGFRHDPLSAYVWGDTVRLRTCDLCHLIWWSLRHSHDTIETELPSVEIRLFWSRQVFYVVAAQPDDFYEIFLLSDGSWSIHHTKKVFIGQLAIYGIRGKYPWALLLTLCQWVSDIDYAVVQVIQRKAVLPSR